MNSALAMHETLLIADSSPLIVLAKIGRLGLLPKLSARIVVPMAVWREVVMNKPASFDSRTLAEAPWLEVQSVTELEAGNLSINVDLGEAEAIALASRFSDCVLLMDERMGRREARRRGVRVLGTLGLLREAKRAGLIESLSNEIQTLLNVGHFLSPHLIEEVLHSVGENP